MEHDPVEEALAAAREVLHQLPILLRRELGVLPMLARLAHQGVMIGVIVAEDEPTLVVSHVPRRDTDTFLPRDLTHDTPRHVDAVREDRRRELDRLEQASRRERYAQCRFEVPSKDRFGHRLIIERAGGKEPERAGMRVLADYETVERVGGNLTRRDRVRDALRFGTIVRA